MVWEPWLVPCRVEVACGEPGLELGEGWLVGVEGLRNVLAAGGDGGGVSCGFGSPLIDVEVDNVSSLVSSSDR